MEDAKNHTPFTPTPISVYRLPRNRVRLLEFSCQGKKSWALACSQRSVQFNHVRKYLTLSDACQGIKCFYPLHCGLVELSRYLYL